VTCKYCIFESYIVGDKYLNCAETCNSYCGYVTVLSIARVI